MKIPGKLVLLLAVTSMMLTESCSHFAGNAAKQDSDSGSFGSTKPEDNKLMGKLYLLKPNTSSLPDFDTMKAEETVLYTSSLNVPSQSWTAGFPGIKDRFEWFGIQYIGFFKPRHSGDYKFSLLSDDGSILYIDGKKIIDNDGLHGPVTKDGNIVLNNSVHAFKLKYFQGPRTQLALQLFWQRDTGKQQLFPGQEIELIAPAKSGFPWWIVLLAAAVVSIVGIYFLRKHKNQSV